MDHNDGVDRDTLLSELRALHRGRGLRRPGVADWLGPTLATLGGVTPAMFDDDARKAVTELLNRYLDDFPADLCAVFRGASGMSIDDPFLEQRLLRVGADLHRGPRVLRRRLRQVEQLLADAIMQEAVPKDAPYAARGWQWVSQRMELTLAETATLDLDRVLLALDDHQKFVSEQMFLAASHPDDVVTAEGFDGVEVLSMRSGRLGLWELTLQLPKELQRGSDVRVRTRVTVSRARALSPYLVLMPMRSTRTLTTVVHFGSPPAASRAWVQDGVLPPVAHVAAHDQVYLDLAADPDPSATFEAPHVGMVYGIAWEWADADAGRKVS